MLDCCFRYYIYVVYLPIWVFAWALCLLLFEILLAYLSVCETCFEIVSFPWSCTRWEWNCLDFWFSVPKKNIEYGQQRSSNESGVCLLSFFFLLFLQFCWIVIRVWASDICCSDHLKKCGWSLYSCVLDFFCQILSGILIMFDNVFLTNQFYQLAPGDWLVSVFSTVIEICPWQVKFSSRGLFAFTNQISRFVGTYLLVCLAMSWYGFCYVL